jgi:pimeloyl-ACP methyl ester carboxylesterase
MAADAGIFAHQKRVFPNLIVPEWPVPKVGDTLSTLCERFADSIRQTTPCVIGGASFGGIVALEMARFLDPLAVILIGSVREPNQLPWFVPPLRPFGGAVSFLPIELLKPVAARFGAGTGTNLRNFRGLARQFGRSNSDVLRWSLRMSLLWDKTPDVNCPVFQIHGERDRVLPARRTTPDEIIAGGGHVISITHADKVNEFIRKSVGLVGG